MFGERLKIIRTENNLKQADLAALLNVSNSTIGMYEQGRRDPDTETIKFLAKHFGVTTDWLLGVSDICNPYKDKKNMPTKAYHNLYQSGLPEEDIKKVEEYIELLKQKHNVE